eukprot:scaffold131901_cov31-Tisochrysis_lutea.AAC.5
MAFTPGGESVGQEGAIPRTHWVATHAKCLDKSLKQLAEGYRRAPCLAATDFAYCDAREARSSMS